MGELTNVEGQENKKQVTITNTFTRPQDVIEIPVTKVWNDNNNEAEKRPESITFVLTGNGQEYELTLESVNIPNGSTVGQWTGTFTNLPKYDDNGDEIEYTLDEKDLNNEFYQKTDINQETKTTTNTFEVPGEKITVIGRKQWDDNEHTVYK